MKKFSLFIITVFSIIVLSACKSDQTTTKQTTTTTQSTTTTTRPVVVYQIPQDYQYDGPAFPSDKLGDDFWAKTGGVMEAKFVRCVDGDTAHFLVKQPDGTTKDESVRFLGIDTRESTKLKEKWGEDASKATCNLLTNAHHTYLELNTWGDPHGTYGRLLAYIWADNMLVQYYLLDIGLAVTLDNGHGDYREVLSDVEFDAMKKHIGVWSHDIDPYWNDDTNSPIGNW